MSRTILAAAAVVACAGLASAGELKLYLQSAEIKEQKSTGEDWDVFAGKPDPFVEASVLGDKKAVKRSGKTGTEKNTHKPSWDESVVTVEVGDEILLKLWDEDLAQHDLIGEYRFTVKAEMLAGDDVVVSFGQVKELKFKIKSK